MKKEIYLYAGIFAVGAALAFWASQPTKDKNADRIAVVSVSASQIGRLTFTAKESEMTARRGPDEKWWIETTKGADKERFLASSKMQETLAQLNPLQAVRMIGKVKDEQLEEYGLKEPAKSLVIHDSKDQELLKLEIGKQAYGSRNVFARESKGGRVILLSGDFIGDFDQSETKLYERTITSVVFEELTEATITHGGKTRKLAHTKRDDKGALLWTDASAEGAAVPSAKSWFERLDRVRIVSFPSIEEARALDSEKVIFQVDLVGRGDGADTLIFTKRLSSTPPTSGQPPAMDYFVKTKFLGTWAKVGSTRVEPLEKDLGTVTGN